MQMDFGLTKIEQDEVAAQFAYAFVLDAIRYTSAENVMDMPIVFLLTVNGLYELENPDKSRHIADMIKNVLLQEQKYGDYPRR